MRNLWINLDRFGVLEGEWLEPSGKYGIYIDDRYVGASDDITEALAYREACGKLGLLNVEVRDGNG